MACGGVKEVGSLCRGESVCGNGGGKGRGLKGVIRKIQYSGFWAGGKMGGQTVARGKPVSGDSQHRRETWGGRGNLDSSKKGRLDIVKGAGTILYACALKKLGKGSCRVSGGRSGELEKGRHLGVSFGKGKKAREKMIHPGEGGGDSRDSLCRTTFRRKNMINANGISLKKERLDDGCVVNVF